VQGISTWLLKAWNWITLVAMALTRLLGWCLVIVVSFLPIKDAAHIDFEAAANIAYTKSSFLPSRAYEIAFQVASQVNEASLFQDLYFLMIVFTVTSFAEQLYYFVPYRQATLPPLIRCAKVIICMYYIFVLVVQGTGTYVKITQAHGRLQTSDFEYYCSFLIGTLCMIFAAEVVIALTDAENADEDEERLTDAGNDREKLTYADERTKQGLGATADAR
jgi:hypothetical protein